MNPRKKRINKTSQLSGVLLVGKRGADSKIEDVIEKLFVKESLTTLTCPASGKELLLLAFQVLKPNHKAPIMNMIPKKVSMFFVKKDSTLRLDFNLGKSSSRCRVSDFRCEPDLFGRLDEVPC